jgi:type IV pilus biogenesis protein PilP
MPNKLNKLFVALFAGWIFVMPGFAADAVDADLIDRELEQMESPDDASADGVAAYNADGSVFQKIADMEQEKVLLQLEKERAQLDLDLDRLAAEKIKLHMEIDTLSGRAEQQQQELETEKAKLEAEAARLEAQKKALTEQPATASAPAKAAAKTADTAAGNDVSKLFRLVNIVGAGKQLQATLEDSASGQRKKISVGKTIDGYTIKSISLDEGVAFEKDGEIQTLNISKDK